jgi:H+/Cl- antiporter ClcA
VRLERLEGIEMSDERSLFGPPGSRRRIVAVILTSILSILLILSVNALVQASPSLTQYQKSQAIQLFSTSAGIVCGLLLVFQEFFELRSKRKIRWHLLGLGIFLLIVNILLITTLVPTVFGGN